MAIDIANLIGIPVEDLWWYELRFGANEYPTAKCCYRLVRSVGKGVYVWEDIEKKYRIHAEEIGDTKTYSFDKDGNQIRGEEQE